ncbi:hypothetical protein [Cellulomonas biazotea]|uniref:hypothetical protein n=1 Tax=Cellulomonas biazotea TaxID=1709 RepID=UPI001031747F|nr:hypothetical protein [Cellulomonas biazotea]
MDFWVAVVGLVSAVGVALVARFPGSRRDDRLRDSISKDVELLAALTDTDLREPHAAHIAARLSELRDLRAQRTSASDALLTLGALAVAVGWFTLIGVFLLLGEFEAARAWAAGPLAGGALAALAAGTVLSLGVYCWQAFGWVRTKSARWTRSRGSTSQSSGVTAAGGREGGTS